MYLDLNGMKSFMRVRVHYKCIRKRYRIVFKKYSLFLKMFFNQSSKRYFRNTKDKPPSPLRSLKPLQSKQSSSSVQVVSVSEALETQNKMLWKQKNKSFTHTKKSFLTEDVGGSAVNPFSVQHLTSYQRKSSRKHNEKMPYAVLFLFLFLTPDLSLSLFYFIKPDLNKWLKNQITL